MPIIKIQMEVAHELLQCTDSTLFKKKRVRPSNAQRESSVIPLGSPSSSVSSNQSKFRSQPDPTTSLRYDKFEHWVVLDVGDCARQVLQCQNAINVKSTFAATTIKTVL